MCGAVSTLEGNDYDDESRSDESTKIFDEVPRETPRHHILLLNRNNFDEVPREKRILRILILNLKILYEVARGTRRHVYFLFKKFFFFDDIYGHTLSPIFILLLN